MQTSVHTRREVHIQLHETPSQPPKKRSGYLDAPEANHVERFTPPMLKLRRLGTQLNAFPEIRKGNHNKFIYITVGIELQDVQATDQDTKDDVCRSDNTCGANST